jgi:cellobiose phosphorylase
LIATFRKRAIVVKKSVDTQAIESDGRYIRALSPDTSKAPHLGSLSSDKLIFFEPIAWSGFSGMADSAQFDKIMALCEKNLYDEFGVALCEGDRTLVEGKLPEDYSGWKRNAPGKKENGGEFRHLESWYIASLCAFGYGKKAYDLYRKTIPAITSEPDPFRYAAERFVYPEYVSSPSSAEHGRAGHTWLTGTAPTRLCVFLDSILGLKRGYEGLRIDPCVNPEWKRFKARRAFRSSDFMITYENPDGLEHGVGELRVDGAKIEGNLVPERFYDGKSHEILVMMAKP